jgi:hypothetical protein
MHLGFPICLLLALGVSSRSTLTHDVCEVRTTLTNPDQSTCTKDEVRHVKEKARLLGRLSRSQGTWEARHPRYRLLDALHAFLAHHELVSKDVDRWRSMYRSVPKHQRKVYRNGSRECVPS